MYLFFISFYCNFNEFFDCVVFVNLLLKFIGSFDKDRCIEFYHVHDLLINVSGILTCTFACTAILTFKSPYVSLFHFGLLYGWIDLFVNLMVFNFQNPSFWSF